jgi:hypothetical protein
MMLVMQVVVLQDCQKLKMKKPVAFTTGFSSTNLYRI